MNIKVQCCGLVLIAFLTIIRGRRKKLYLTTSKVFEGCLYSTMLCLLMDILSIFGIVYRDRLPAHIPEFVCKTYLVSLASVALLAVAYVTTNISYHLPGYKKFMRSVVTFGALLALLIYVLPIYMHEVPEENLAWTDGPSCYVTYFGVFAFILINLVQIFKHKEYIYPRQRRTVLIWMFMWIAAASIQVMNKHLLIVGFASALGIAAVYVQFESTELNHDRSTGLFNYAAFTRYAEQLYSGSKDFYVIAVTLENAVWQQNGNTANVTSSIRAMYDSFLKIPGAAAFKIMEKEVILIFSRHEEAMAAWQNFIKHSEYYALNELLRFSYYLVENPRCVSSHRELLELIQYAGLMKTDAVPDSFSIIDENTLAQMLSERRMTQQIIDALEEDRVVVYYQPIYSVEKKRFTSAEALVRIVGRDGKLIPPGAFISIAESNGMITDLGKRVFEKVCHFIREYRPENYGIEYIEINLSVVQCRDSRLADDYLKLINTIGIDPCRINLEITESASTKAKRVVITNMERMIDRGVHFSLDDFGTGASNLNYIVDMPVRIVKFDREMTQAYFANGKAKYVMDAAMHMIHGMGLEIVAEGVETEEQYKKMEEIKINFIQGYYFSKPLPEQEFLEFLCRENAV